jgi:spore coat polysaccharide biosynthesis predicted glycosyltransferase SpsG
MSQLKRVDIICDGDERIGYGHIRRSLALAEQLEKDGLAVRLVGLSEQAIRALPAVDSSDEPASVVIFDAPRGIEEHIDSVVNNGQACITLDWFGEAVPDVNIAIYPHGELRARRMSYTGFEYIIIRDEIIAQRGAASVGSGKKVLVCLGGGDLLHQAHQAASKLSEQGLDVVLVQGPLAADTTEDDKFQVLVSPAGLPGLMASADWLVTNGGGCLFEALCLGKAVVVLPQTDQETKIAAYAAEKSTLLGIGMDALRQYGSDELMAVMGRGDNLVDGRGAERISQIVRGLL